MNPLLKRPRRDARRVFAGPIVGPVVGPVIALSALILLAGCSHSRPETAPTPDWIELFDGESLTGWTQVNGKAPYTIVGGALHGINVLDTPNSFLASDQSYSNFILEFDSRSIGEANSGVQFRTDLAPGTWSGVVGYQLDIDPTERRWTGGIYHEGVHLWRHSMARNTDCQAAYNHGEWNAYRIEAVGNTIATWVNDVACAHMVSDAHESGFIALQIHSIGQEESFLGSFTEWRNLRLLDAPAPADLWLDRRSALVEGWLTGQISEVEAQKGWHTLAFENDTATLSAPDGAFEAVVDVQLSDGAEARLLYTLMDTAQTCIGAYKVLDDAMLADARPESEHMGSLAGKRAAKNLSEPGRPKRVYADQRPNRIRLIARPERVEHWLNGVKLVDYPRCAADLTVPATPSAEARPKPDTRLVLETESGQVEILSAQFRPLSD